MRRTTVCGTVGGRPSPTPSARLTASAAADLAQAQEIALFGGMRLYQADVHLETARLHLARHQRGRSTDQLEQALRSLAAAKEMYNGMGYRCRYSAVADLERLL
jgi:hypothetical protein